MNFKEYGDLRGLDDGYVVGLGIENLTSDGMRLLQEAGEAAVSGLAEERGGPLPETVSIVVRSAAVAIEAARLRRAQMDYVRVAARKQYLGGTSEEF